MEENKDETNPELPESVAVEMKGMKLWPSNNAEEALKEEDTRAPDTSNIRSCSIIEFAVC